MRKIKALKAVDKKTKILQCAITCIKRFGIERTTAQTIASELDIAQSGIFYHFPKQEELFDALFELIIKQNVAMVEEQLAASQHSSSKMKLCAYFKGNLLWAKGYPDHVEVMLHTISKCAHDRQLQVQLQSVLGQGEERIYQYLVVGVAEQEFKVRGDIRDLARLIHRQVFGSLVAFHYHQSPSSVANYTQSLMTLVEHLLIEKS